MSEIRKYSNPWIPARAIEILQAESGSILDVGGGASAYHRASHVIDIMPFDSDRLTRNAWGAQRSGGGRRVMATPNAGFARTEDRGRKTDDARLMGSAVFEPQRHKDTKKERVWEPDAYTQMDLCAGERWPFDDKQFDLGLSSHCLEDLRDPIQVVTEMGRVCRQVLIICPSRLFEQMRGVDHPRYCGMPHHVWLVSEHDGVLEFRRKTPIMEFPGLHLVCPITKILSVEAGSMCYLSDSPQAKEIMYFDLEEDKQEHIAFVKKQTDLHQYLQFDKRWLSWKRWFWHFRQKCFYAI